MAKIQLFRDPESGFVYTEKPANVEVEEFNPPADHPEWGKFVKGEVQPQPKPEPQVEKPATDVL